MKLGIVSDTHGNTPLATQAVTLLDSYGVEQVIHCGDIGSADVIRLFHAWPTHFVSGNCDDSYVMEQAVEHAGQHWHGLFGELEFGGKRIAFLHSHEPGRLSQSVQSGQYDLVCYGHTHVAKLEYESETAILNPGALYRVHRHSIAVAELPEMTIEHVYLD